jgi:hypothetical protein
MLVDPLSPSLQIAPPGVVETASIVLAGAVLLVVGAGITLGAWRNVPPTALGAGVAALVAIGLVLDVTPLRVTTSNSDRFLYLPVAMLVVIAATVARRAAPRGRVVLATATLSLVAVFSFRTHARAKEWTDEVQLWSVTANEAPWSSVAAHELAAALSRAGRFEEALEAYRRAATMASGPARLATLKNVAATLGDLERLDEAAAELRAAMATSPVTEVDHFNLGLIELKRRAFADAETELRRALALKPDFSPAHQLLAALPARRAEWASLPPVRDGEPASLTARRATYEQRLGLPRRAIGSWSLVAEAPDADAQLLVAACRALAVAGRGTEARAGRARARAARASAELLAPLDAALSSITDPAAR